MSAHAIYCRAAAAHPSYRGAAEAGWDAVEAHVAAARAEARREAFEEAANVADDHCRHATRLCVRSCEDLCKACTIAAALRAKAGED
jgi:hypothetical protein